MLPDELLPGTPIQTRTPLPLRQGTIRARTMSSGAPSPRGYHAVVDFVDGASAVLVHWQLEKQATAPLSTSTMQMTAMAPMSPMASEPAPTPGSCKPLHPSWKDDAKVGALYMAQHPDGRFALSLVLTQPDGTGRQILRHVDLDTETLAAELVRMGLKLAKVATIIREQQQAPPAPVPSPPVGRPWWV